MSLYSVYWLIGNKELQNRKMFEEKSKLIPTHVHNNNEFKAGNQHLNPSECKQ